MPRYDFRAPRLFVDSPLAANVHVGLTRDQVNYLRTVLRLRSGDPVLVFNGSEGEWRALLVEIGKRDAALTVVEQAREQTPALDLHYLFAPLKHARLDYIVQKAVEMGASRLQPVLTRHTQASRINLERMRANIIEAAEQCGILTVPEIAEPLSFDRTLAALPADRLLVFCDEAAEVKDPIAALAAARAAHHGPAPVSVIIGPEGGFSDDERAALIARPGTLRLALGPRILRADTAAVAALALVGAVLGDWSGR